MAVAAGRGGGGGRDAARQRQQFEFVEQLKQLKQLKQWGGRLVLVVQFLFFVVLWRRWRTADWRLRGLPGERRVQPACR